VRVGDGCDGGDLEEVIYIPPSIHFAFLRACFLVR
jgi:hypothetical protein